MVDPTPNPAEPVRRPRVALAHDWLVARRGGELVLDAIIRAVEPHAEITRLYTMFDSGEPVTGSIDSLDRSTGALNKMPASLRRWSLPLYPVAVRGLSRRLARDHAREPIDLLISTSSAAIKSMRPPPGVPHLCYCHTPARYLWSQRRAYSGPGTKGRLRGIGLGLFGPFLRRWDRVTANRVTAFIANSAHTAQEVRSSYNRDATVIHPPVRTDLFTPDGSITREPFLLVVSALEPYKRIDLAIDAAADLGIPLHIVGSGSHDAVLRAHSTGHDRVRFLGRLSDAELVDQYRRCRALVMPQTEDFGITAIEAQACGTPVVARRAGGTLDSVIDNETGALFDGDDEVRALADAVGRCPPPSERCRAHAECFGDDAFRARLIETVRALIKL